MPESIATPCSVKASGRDLRRLPQPLEITNCDFKFADSSVVLWDMKSLGKRSVFRFAEISILVPNSHQGQLQQPYTLPSPLLSAHPRHTCSKCCNISYYIGRRRSCAR